MQSESNEANQESSLTRDSQNSHHDSQYGFDQQQQLSPWPNAGVERPNPRRAASETKSHTSSTGGSDGSRERSLRRLSPPSRSQTGSPVDRINDHERSLAYLRKRRNDGPTFTVVQRTNRTSVGQVAFADFPNEVLTHVLSHLPPSSLSEVSRVSRRFHELVTTPHAWRLAFSRFFPGAELLNNLESSSNRLDDKGSIQPERRVFTRLTALASWRSEYILRTRLLWSLVRGKPANINDSAVTGSAHSNKPNTGSAHVTYNSDLIAVVDHLHATFGTGIGKRLPRFIHGATDNGMASSSDPRMGKVDQWGFTDTFAAQHFADLYPGDALFGLGAGDVVGVPNVMDISQPYGMIYAEGLPGGRVYYRSTEEKRGRVLTSSLELSIPELGIPSTSLTEAMCATWIAKTSNIPHLSEGLIGLLVGSSQGVLTSYSLGTNSLHERRLERGELTARWVLSPGIPIIAIAVDENFSLKRHSFNRIWATVLNALGEIYFLAEFPVRQSQDRATKLGDVELEKMAWKTGRTVNWNLVEPTRRTARPDPFDNSGVDGSYSPRSTWDGIALSKEQLIAETREIDNFLQKKPKEFCKVCEGWDMRRRLEVDFAGSDGNGAGESILVISCALDGGQQAQVKRFTRYTLKESPNGLSTTMQVNLADSITTSGEGRSSVFGGNVSVSEEPFVWRPRSKSLSRRSSSPGSDSPFSSHTVEEWRTSVLSFEGLKSPQITATAIDSSTFATLTRFEDSLLVTDGSSVASSPISSPMRRMVLPNSSTDIPGQRARLLALGTKAGNVILWNIRAPVANNAILENSINPVRIIHTDSLQISCLALTALHLVHGGNDGLVQAWDPLASDTDPIRTLNSRFSSRARRRLVQAEASPAGVGINYFAASAICLDPDPTVLRGMVTLGSHLRYWSYSSQIIDHHKGSKRRLRRSERGNNQSGERFSQTGRGALKDYITTEKLELEHEKKIKRKEEERLSGRFGLGLLGPGASEDEIMVYATMLSEEAAENDELRRREASTESSNDTVTGDAMVAPLSPIVHDEPDNDIAEAVRLSLQENSGFQSPNFGQLESGASNFTVKYAKSKKSPSPSPPRNQSSKTASKLKENISTPIAEMDDLQFAMQLSRAEEESRAESVTGKGKRRAF